MTPRLPRSLLLLLPILVLAACTGNPPGSPTPPASIAPSATARASDTPEPSPSSSPDATKGSSPAPSESETGFAIAPNPDADALFADRDECVNETDGYQLEFPADWTTNPPQGETDQCRRFAPGGSDPTDPAEMAIAIDIIDGAVEIDGEPTSADEGVIGRTQPATRFQTQDETIYVVELGPSAEIGPNLVARTSTEMGGDYELNVAVLDRMMATMELLGSIE